MTEDTIATKMDKNTGFHPVHKPEHYNKHPSGIQCIEVTRHLSGDLAAAFKYVFRYEDKENPIQDLQKALFYIDDELSIDNYDYVQMSRDIAEKIKKLLEKIQYAENHGFKSRTLYYIATANFRNSDRRLNLEMAKRYIQELIDSKTDV